MAGTDQLLRIAELTARLEPLGDKRRGMPIEADDWNALVDALLGVLGVDRAQETATRAALQTGFAPLGHEHLGAVAVPWLDPNLQDRVAQGEGPIGLRLAVADAVRRVDALTAEVARLAAIVEAGRREADRAAVADLERGRKLTELEGRFAGLEDLRTSVGRLATQVDGLGGTIATVLEFRGQLTDPSGEPIDVASLRDTVASLEALEERLTGVDGEPIRARDLEIRIQELADAVGAGAGGGLDDRIAGVVGAAEERLASRLDERTAAIEEAEDARVQALEVRIDERMESSSEQLRSEMDAAIGDRVATLRGELTEVVDARVAAARDGLATELAANATDLIESRLAGVPALIQADIASARIESEAALTESLTAAIDARIGEARAALEQRMSTVEATVAGLDDMVGAVVDTRVAEALPGLESRLDERMTGALDLFRDELGGIIDDRLLTGVADAMADVDGRISSEMGRQIEQLEARTSAAIDARFAELQPLIADEVGAQLQAADIDGRISSSADRLRQEFDAQLGGALAEIQAETQDRLAGAIRTFDARIGDLEALRLEIPPRG